jgi:uncharacterized membrane protein HdeD (DUF308 family)
MTLLKRPTPSQEPIGFPFLAKWAVELVLGGIYLFGAVCLLVFVFVRDRAWPAVASGLLLLAAGWYFYRTGWKMSYALFAMAALTSASGVYLVAHRVRYRDSEGTGPASKDSGES